MMQVKKGLLREQNLQCLILQFWNLSVFIRIPLENIRTIYCTYIDEFYPPTMACKINFNKIPVYEQKISDYLNTYGNTLSHYGLVEVKR